MSNTDRLGAVIYESEGESWAPATSTFATLRLPILDAVDVTGLVQGKMAPGRVVQYLQDDTDHILGTFKGSTFKTRTYLTGHGSATSGATSIDPYETWLGYVIGAAVASSAAGTTVASGTAAVPVTVASGTFLAGSLARYGTLGDARGGGQFGAIATHTLTAMTMLTALAGAPSAADVVHSAVNIYTPETVAAAAIQPLRFFLMTANVNYECRGCWPISYTISGLGHTQIPTIEVTWGVSYWKESTALTFPTTVATNAYNPGPIVNGSLFLAAVGTPTNATRTHRDFSITITTNTIEKDGPGGVNAGQVVVGAYRGPSEIEVSWTEDADAATTTPVLGGYFTTAGTEKHALFTGSCVAGSALGIYFPRLLITKTRPVQYGDNGCNRMRITAKACTGPTKTTDLTASAMRIGFA